MTKERKGEKPYLKFRENSIIINDNISQEMWRDSSSEQQIPEDEYELSEYEEYKSEMEPDNYDSESKDSYDPRTDETCMDESEIEDSEAESDCYETAEEFDDEDKGPRMHLC